MKTIIAKDIGELLQALSEEIASGNISTEDTWYGYDDGSLNIVRRSNDAGNLLVEFYPTNDY